jgi:hypothetical protein
LPGPLRFLTFAEGSRQFVTVRLEFSQCELDGLATFGSLLVKVTNHETSEVYDVVLFVVSVLSAADVAFVSVFEYGEPTALAATQPVPV